MRSLNPKINSHLLNIYLKEHKMTIKAIADELGFKVTHVYNWIYGVAAPPVTSIKKLAEFLQVSPSIFYISGTTYVGMGVQSALTRWSKQHQELERESINDNDALNFIKSTASDALDETDEEINESPFHIQGPSESPDSSE